MHSLCPKCGQPVSAYAPQGLCPCCLLLGGLAATADAVASSEFEVSSSGTIRYFGDYELLEEIARGGMGVVYRARQLSLNRLVALKMIAAGRLATPQAVERFRTETEAVALLDHPNIVPIYQVGAEAGMHYYAMKLVEGGSLAEGMQKEEGRMKKQSLGRRASSVFLHSSFSLLHFIKVARAVHYAHQRGILHRDLKPANILLDQSGEPYVTDFGLAKFVVPPLGGTEQPAKAGTTNPLTRSLAIIGTPSYMAPEQAAGQSKRLTTAADIYSLGAILYELLAGRPPFTGENELEILRRVVEEEPLPPSLICRSRPVLRSGTAEGGREEAHKAKSEIGNRKSEIDKDLETICLKCLHKEPQSRYGSAEALAQDLERWRAGETIQARPSTAVERTWRWCRRKPALAGALTAVTLLLVTIAVVSTTMALRLKLAKDRAQSAEVDAKAKARQATESAAEAQSVLRFFQDKVLAAARPEDRAGGLGREATIRAAADAAEPLIAKSFTNQPLVEASIRDTLGQTYHYLGDNPKAISQLERALALRREKLDADHYPTRTFLARAYWHDGQRAEGLRLFEEIFRRYKAKLGPEHPDTLMTAHNLAAAYHSDGRRSEALAMFEEILKLQKAKLGSDHPDTILTLQSLSNAYWDAGRPNDALPLMEETMKLRRTKLGPDHLDTLSAMSRLAGYYLYTGRRDDALPLIEETVKSQKAKLGPEHPETLGSMNILGLTYQETGRWQDALPLFEEILKVRKAKIGPGHPETLLSMNNLAGIYQQLGRRAEAMSLLEEALELNKAVFGPDHPKTLESMHNLATVYWSLRRLHDAVPMFEETVRLRMNHLGPEHPDTIKSMKQLGGTYRASGRLAEALSTFEMTLKLSVAKLGPDHPDTLSLMDDLADAYAEENRLGEAEKLLRDLVEWTRRNRGPDSRTLANRLVRLGACLVRQRNAGAAEPLLREALPILEKHQPGLSFTFTAQSLLGWALLDQKKYAEAEGLLVQAYKGLDRRETERPSPSRAQALKAIGERIVQLYEALGKPAQAGEWKRKITESDQSTSRKRGE